MNPDSGVRLGEGAYREILDHSDNVIFAKDLDGRYTLANRRFAQMFGMDATEILGKTDEDLFPAWLAARIREDDRRAVELDDAIELEELVTIPHGQMRVLTRKFPHRLDDGTIVGVIGVVRDVTGQRARERQLSEALDSAQAAGRAKSEFIANLSHEIRTPMAAIMGAADALCDAQIEAAERRSIAENVRSHGRHLLTILDDLLDISKAEAGRIEIECVPTRLDELAREVVELLAVTAGAKGVTLDVESGPRMERVRLTDPTRVRQILLNLVGNAVKFTERGGVRVVLGECDAGGDSVYIEVVDTGIGIARDRLESIFEPFVQQDGSTTRRFGGTGLGLSICQRLAQLLGGELSVESRVGHGSRFRVGFPASLAGEAAQDREGAEAWLEALDEDDGGRALPGARILLAEDTPVIHRLVTLFLSRAGAEVVVVENGQDAVERAIEAEGGPSPFSLVLLDMQMPEMDGYEAARALRRAGYGRPIVALTAHASEDNARACLEAGCDAHLGKPVDQASLVGACGMWIRRGRRAA